MSRHTMLSIVASAALLATATVASGSGPVPEPTQGEAKPAKPKKICKRLEADMGSRMASRICKTEAEWKAEAAAGREAFLSRDKD